MTLKIRKKRKERFEVIDSAAAMNDYARRIEIGCGHLGIAVEALDGDFSKAEIKRVIIVPQGLPVAVVSMNRLREMGMGTLGKILDSQATVKIAHDWVRLLPLLQQAGFMVEGELFDVKIASQLLNAGIKVQGDKKGRKYEFTMRNMIKKYLEEVPPDEPLDRVIREASALIPLQKILRSRLMDIDLHYTADIEFECIPAVAQMHIQGIGVDNAKMEALYANLVDGLEVKGAELSGLLGNDINLNSNAQVLSALNNHETFRRAGLEIGSNSKKALLPYAADYPVVQALLGYNLVKRKKGVVESYIKNIHPKTKRLHASYDSMGAVTGRFSCKKPPMQGLPKNKEIRSCFVSGMGRKIVIADYSQIELRIAAAISQDKKMLTAFQKGEDFHRLTASLISDTPYEKVTEHERNAAKAINFGVLFGMEAQSLKEYALYKYGVIMSIDKAEQLRGALFSAYPQLNAWCRKQEDNTSHWIEEDGVWETRTMCGRIRLWRDVGPSGSELVNTPIQGTAADIIKIALGGAVEQFKGMDAVLVACVHDEIIVETDEEIAYEISEILEGIMKDAAKEVLDSVPVEVDVAISDSLWVE